MRFPRSFSVTFFQCALLTALVLLGMSSCKTQEKPEPAQTATSSEAAATALDPALARKYTEFRLTTNMDVLTENERKLIPILIEVGQIMNDIFWVESYGDRDAFLNAIADTQVRRFAEINYGPWDRLNGNRPFVDGAGEKPLGANFYPADATKAEVESAADPSVREQYTMVRRGEDGTLQGIPYRQFFEAQITLAAEKIMAAAALADDAGLKKYLELRAQALLTDDYLASDLAWMDMKTNTIDFVVGPIETYEDQLLGKKSAHAAYVLVKDQSWSQRLGKYAALLPELQRELPVAEQYKRETPGSDSDLGAYDVIYYAGDCNAGSKTIAVNLPNDERVQLQKGTRRIQLKNSIRAKFDKILLPIADVMIVPDQRAHITFDAFFSNTMFHEVAHGLGIKNTIDGKGTVSDALREEAGALEEGKADILGLYMISKLLEKGEMEGDIRDNYVTFIAGIFRSSRFGASSAHGRANMLRFNFFLEMGAFERDPETGMYRVVFEKMDEAVTALSQLILKFQGDGDYAGVVKIMSEKGKVTPQLKADLDRLATFDIPTDIVFEQGVAVLGL